MKLLKLSMFALSALLCGAMACTVTAEDGAGGAGGDGGPGPGGGGPMCSASNACPTGQFCFNGICAPGCTSDENCDANKYCDTQFLYCVPREVVTCETGGCDAGYDCVNTYCIAHVENPAGCRWRENMTDGCAQNEICMQESENVDGECLMFPACPENGDCPNGTEGAVCNVDYIPSKGRICLTGLCHETTDCPEGMGCEIFPGQTSLGYCAVAGEFGSSCEADADCNNDLVCSSPGPGFPRTCTMGGGGGCFMDSDCAGGEFCNPMTQACVAGSGTDCFDDSECPAGESCDMQLMKCF